VTSKHATNAGKVILWDLVLSVLFWVLTLIFVLGSALTDFVALAFLDACPPQGCAVGVAIGAHLISWFITLGLTVFSAVFIVRRLRSRQRAWTIALLMLVVVVLVWALGFAIATVAVGGLTLG
jgi:uncharacterized membrane protein YhaH (DUF805 family)